MPTGFCFSRRYFRRHLRFKKQAPADDFYWFARAAKEHIFHMLIYAARFTIRLLYDARGRTAIAQQAAAELVLRN